MIGRALAVWLLLLVIAMAAAAGHPWSRLLHDYDVTAGRVWIVVLLTTSLRPWLLGRMQASG